MALSSISLLFQSLKSAICLWAHTTIPAESQQLNYPLCSLEIPCLFPAPCPSSRRHIKTRSWALVLINIPPDLFAKLEIIVLVCWPTSSVQIAFGLLQIPLAAGGGRDIWMFPVLCCAVHTEWARLGAGLQWDGGKHPFWIWEQLKLWWKMNTNARSSFTAHMEKKRVYLLPTD